ncbi:peptidylprolyl isomerase [Cohnella zeiphila]|uniref:Foldase protein PrsA n=1 Tax=Cohnella zeiphila TaxID=2761120 RepID=A0A7X0SIC1_9BACL|nr:peptidylprolyl isomerase [Cohnella zeiphila]MBB6730502.1 peptidylprolyl isomerase [Cohnella zeiphila]
MSEENKDPLQAVPSDERPESDKPEENVEIEEERSAPVEEAPKAKPAPAAVRPAPAKPAASGGGNKSWPWIAIAVIAIAALIFVLVRDSGGNSMNKAVGELDGKSITQADLYNEMVKTTGEAQMGQQLDQIMMFKVISNEAGKTGGQVTDADVDAYIADIKKKNNFTTDDQFSQALASSGMTLDQFKEQTRPQLELRLIFAKKLNPSEDDLKAYFDKNKDNYGTPEQVRASHILLQTKEEAEAVLKQLKQGADFATLAKEKSIDTGSKDNGGDLGFFGKGVMNEQFETAAFALKTGEMSDVVQSPNGYHIIKLTDRKEAVAANYDDVKDQVKNDYLDEKINEGFSDWFTEAKKTEGYKNFLTQEDATTATETPPADSVPSESAAPSGSASSDSSASASPSASSSPSASPSASASQ